MPDKQMLLRLARQHVARTQQAIVKGKIQVADKISELKHGPSANSADQVARQVVLRGYEEKQVQLNILEPSPYFARLDVHFDGHKQPQSLYFAKHAFPEEAIYSWVSPAATLRFQDPGEFAYAVPDHRTIRGSLHRKDQYMIHEGDIIFMASESDDYPRTLIHQKFLSRQKTFGLQEIVEQMEQRQDQVIRADARGPLLISGPAGSGKTTLALHRVAYLVQSPETAPLFRQKHIIVFVEDERAKDYFGQVLPELGIKRVQITTWGEWAAMALGRDPRQFTHNRDIEWPERILFENEKLSHNQDNEIKKTKTFDRIDTTRALTNILNKHDTILFPQEEVNVRKNKIYRKTKRLPLEYDLIVIDEIQNYLPEQIRILRSCLNPKTDGFLFVGDLNQQIKAGTLTRWDQLKSTKFTLDESRVVQIDKVYRHSAPIMRFLKEIGLPVSQVDETTRHEPVKEVMVKNTEHFCKHVQNNINSSEITGILCFSEKEKVTIQTNLQTKEYSKIKILTAAEAQGLEFDTVFLYLDDSLTLANGSGSEKGEEKLLKKIRRDLLYIALTRTREKLTLLAKKSPVEMCKTIMEA